VVTAVARDQALTLPGLDRVETLSNLRGRPEAGFLRAQITREVNRMRAAVREALATAGAAGGV
jgi:hypothetical protein